MSRAPEAIRLVYLCQFVVRAYMLSGDGFSWLQLCRLWHPGPRPCGTPTSNRVTDSVTASRSINLHVRCRNINLLSIVYAFRPQLRTRLTLGGFTFPRKPQTYGEQDFHLLYRYSCRHTHLLPLQPFFRSTFTADSNAPLPIQIALDPAASANILFPFIYGALNLGQ